MDAETCVEGTINLDNIQKEEQRTGGEIEELIPHRMIVANGDIDNGCILDTQNGPKVLEMSCEAENNTENTKDLQKYSSKLKENTTIEDDGAFVKEKQYEESAVRARSEKTDMAEVSSKSQIKFEENEKIRHTDEGPAVAEYNAKSEEKHQTSVTTTEPVGDSLVTRTRSSEKNVSKTCRRIEEVDGDTAGITDSASKHEHEETSSVDKNEEECTIVKRMEKKRKSETSETKIIGGQGDTSILDKYETMLSNSATRDEGASIDLGALGEIRLSTQIGSAEDTMDRDYQHGLTYASDYSSANQEQITGSGNYSGSQHHVGSKYQEDKIYGESSTHAHSAHTASSSSHQVGSPYSSLGSSKMAQENGDVLVDTSDTGKETEPPPFRPFDRKSADDLVKRILAESQGKSGGSMKHNKIKVDMGGGSESQDISSSSFCSLPPTLNATPKESRESVEAHSYNAYNEEDRESTASSTRATFAESSGFMERAVGAERKRTTSEGDLPNEEEENERPSLFERRFGAENKLENLFTGTEASSSSTNAGLVYGSEEFQKSYSKKGISMSEDYQGQSYGRKAVESSADYQIQPYKKKEKDDFDELDEEINVMRSRYRDINTKRYDALYGPDQEEDEPYQPVRPRGRGLMRQGYVDSDDLYGPPPEEEVLPDEYFEPSRREETDEIVKERTQDIRTVVNKQSSVLEKLRQASESFDELTNEIKNIKQQFFENQARRQMIMDDEEEIEMPSEPRRGQYQRSLSYGGDYSYGGATGGGVDNDEAIAYSPYGLGPGYKPYVSIYARRQQQQLQSAADEEDTSSFRSSRSSRFSKRTTGWGRSKSLYDDAGLVVPQGLEAGEGESPARDTWAPPSPRVSRFGQMENGDDTEEATQVKQYGQYGEISRYGADSGSRAYGGGVTSGGDFDYSTPSYRRASDTDHSSFSSSRFASSYTSDYSSASSPGGRYTSRYGGNARQGFMAMRSKTLGDYSTSSYDSQLSPSGSQFSSRFLSKVRKDRATGGTEESSTKSKDKPFKSRFLRKSFDTDYSSSYSSSKYSSRFKSSSIDTGGSTSISGAGTSETSSKQEDSAPDTTETSPPEATAAE